MQHAEHPIIWELRERMTKHLRDVRLRRDKPINSHFGGVAHGPVDFTFAVLEKVFGAERIERQLREAIWIRRVSTARPDGYTFSSSGIHGPGLTFSCCLETQIGMLTDAVLLGFSLR